MECKNCNSKNIEEDNARAEMICQDCGEICEVVDIQGVTEFHEMDNGKIVAIGKTINSQESRQNTMNKAQAKIESLCSKLYLKKNLAAYALKIYESVLTTGLTRGKRSAIMIGACVYLAARIKHQSLMLLDISDKINENVYTLGKVYNTLKMKLGQKVVDIDPCMFIDRFANQLEFGDQREAVCTTALKLLQRMKKDWISTGRRPSGITAAALLIAARIHNFDRDYEDVARIAGIGKNTAKKRLKEWSETSTANLTLSEFQTIDYEEEFDPPSFAEGKGKAHKHPELEMSDEEFAKIQREMKALKERLTEAENSSETDRHLSQLVDCVEQGVADMKELIGDIDDNTEGDDYCQELVGRLNLVRECLGGTMIGDVFSGLSKHEDELDENDSVAGPELPMTIPINEADGASWLVSSVGKAGGELELDMTDIDDDELRSLYIYGRHESILKMRCFVNDNKEYYRNKKLAQQRKEDKVRHDTKIGRKPRTKRIKRDQLMLQTGKQLLCEMKADALGAAEKMAIYPAPGDAGGYKFELNESLHDDDRYDDTIERYQGGGGSSANSNDNDSNRMEMETNEIIEPDYVYDEC